MRLFEAGWRRGGFGDSNDELQFRDKAVGGARPLLGAGRAREAEPAWIERSFSFQLGPHLLRGRVDRVDRLPDGALRADRLQDGQAEERGGSARGRAAVALPDGCARVVGARDLGAELLLRARQREGAGGALRGRARARARHGQHDRRGDHGAGVRAHPVAGDLLRSATTGSSARRRRSSLDSSALGPAAAGTAGSRCAIASADGISSDGAISSASSIVSSSRSTNAFTSGSLSTAAFTWRS